MKENDYLKGEFQHNIFKFIILIMIGIFLCLILGFIYVTFFSPKKTDIDIKLSILNNIDHLKMEKYNKTIPYCDIDLFYINQISKRLPCIYKYDNKSTEQYNLYIKTIENNLNENFSVDKIGFVYFLDKYMKFIQFNIINKNNNYFSLLKAENTGKIFINMNNETINFSLSPLSQFKKLNAFKNETYKEFNSFYSNKEIFNDNLDNLISFQVELNKGDLLYVPSYFFIQIQNVNKDLLMYEYQDSNKMQDWIFKALFDYNTKNKNF